jgi:hypothetical protein
VPLNLVCDPLLYSCHILQHVAIPEPYDTDVQFLEIPVALGVAFLATHIGVLSAINFDG